MSLRVAYDERSSEHEAPFGHPESFARVDVSVRALREEGFGDTLVAYSTGGFFKGGEGELTRVHDPAYLAFLREDLAGRRGFLNADTFYAPGSVEIAWRSAGLGIAITRDVLAGEVERGLALVRPPGHHAERRRGKGFCLLNNVALAAAEARARGARVAVVDFDVHHGDGTQQAFWEDPDLLFVSLHRLGPRIYPGTGGIEERGGGAGEGMTANFPLAAGADRAVYVEIFDHHVGPRLQSFAPDLIFVSAGFDAHVADPISDTALDDTGYDEIIARLCEWSDRWCAGRMVVFLEGGYVLRALSRGVVTLIRRMLG
ncbi:MAG: histone deacetylase [Deltaproteobacteria bacterium]|nr:histone deacetylase [Deltaproteobacteria bacterium]